MLNALQKFKRKPVFTGFILFLAVLLLNLVIQGISTCITNGPSAKNFFALFSPNSINTLMRTNLPFVLVTMGQALLLIVGQMDVSIGIQIALVNVVCIMVPQEFGVPVWVGWLCGLGASLLVSLLCDFCCSILRLFSAFSSRSYFLIR